MFCNLGILNKQQASDLGTLNKQDVKDMGIIIKPDKFVYMLITEDDCILITEDSSYKLIV